eukprot:TRINITY_DN9790_c0_g1_i1.p1 TRINITY_DN9790_c0_g1~~TRINITY_DN9790_c0_g1_i1.p1  ORF type:complete len:878 (+),score=167.67 TRINITY_DN9790_c0_g1_i1:61-2694(+)
MANVLKCWKLFSPMLVHEEPGSSKREKKCRQAGVIKVEIATRMEVWIMIFVLIATMAYAINNSATDSFLGYKVTKMEGPVQMENGQKQWTINKDPGLITFLSYVRIKLLFSSFDLENTHFPVSYNSTILDGTGSVISSSLGSEEVYCTLIRCGEDEYLPSKSGTGIPSEGNLTGIVVMTYNENATSGNHPSVELQVKSAGYVMTQVVARYTMGASLVYHFFRYADRCLNARDALRPEQGIILLNTILTVVYCNPFSFLAVFPSTNGVIGVLLYQLPQLYTHASLGLLWGFTVAVEKDVNTLPVMLYRLLGTILVLGVLQLAFCIDNMSTSATIPSSINLEMKTGSYIISLMNSVVKVALFMRVIVGLNGIGCFRLGFNALKHTSYFKTRDRQLLGRMFTVIVFCEVLYAVLATTRVDEDTPAFGTTGAVVFSSLGSHILLICTTPVYLQTEYDKVPPSPITNDWKTVKWRPEWLAWMHSTPGSLCLYRFITKEEEDTFWSLQENIGGPIQQNGMLLPPVKDMHFNAFDYETCLLACHLSAECYKLDTKSAATSSAVGALVVLASVVADRGREHHQPRKSPSVENTKKPAAVLQKSSHYHLHHVVKHSGMQVLMGTVNNYFFIAFRGSSNIQNWLDDIKVPRVPWDEVQITTHTGGCCVTKSPQVHKGFLTLWQALRDKVLDCVMRYRAGRPMLITGHSLGAAMAVLCSFTVSLRVCPVEVWTFGCPLVGNKGFAKCYNQVVPKCYRVVNENDLVTRARLTVGNRHVGTYVVLGVGNGWLATDPPMLERMFSPTRFLWNSAIAHSITNYQAALAASYLDASPLPNTTLPKWSRTTIPPRNSCCCFCCCDPRQAHVEDDDEVTEPAMAVVYDEDVEFVL